MKITKRAWISVWSELFVEISGFVIITAVLDLARSLPLSLDDTISLTLKFSSAIFLLFLAAILRSYR